MQFLSLLVLANPLANSSGTATWVKIVDTLNTYPNTYVVIASSTNNTPDENQFTYTATGYYWQYVDGDTSTAPPWTSKFTTLSWSMMSGGDTNRMVEIPPWTSFQRRLYYDKEEGVQSWIDTDQMPSPNYTRSRRWDTNAYLYDWWG